MAFPFFYAGNYDASSGEIVLDEDTSRHIVQVLRMEKGEKINLTDGKGNLFTCTINTDHKRHCSVSIESKIKNPKSKRNVAIGISLLKNANRFEWFLEKAAEMGVNEIIPLICERTEKEKFRHDRMQTILASAMIQSQQCWLPVLHEPIAYELLFRQEEVALASQKLIAHCAEGEKVNLADLVNEMQLPRIILIGPEGDFTKEEIDLALRHHFIPVALGETRLRAETAGVVAAAILKTTGGKNMSA
jgi:16S rRNA (uracil1498-N3)-methyltransferase